MPLLRKLIEELGDVEHFIVSAGTGSANPALAWEAERDTIAVNVLGFTSTVNVAVAHLDTRIGASRGNLLSGSTARKWLRASLQCFQGVCVELPPGREESIQEVQAADRSHRFSRVSSTHAWREETSGWPLRKQPPGKSPQRSAGAGRGCTSRDAGDSLRGSCGAFPTRCTPDSEPGRMPGRPFQPFMSPFLCRDEDLRQGGRR